MLSQLTHRGTKGGPWTDYDTLWLLLFVKQNNSLKPTDHPEGLGWNKCEQTVRVFESLLTPFRTVIGGPLWGLKILQPIQPNKSENQKQDELATGILAWKQQQLVRLLMG